MNKNNVVKLRENFIVIMMIYNTRKRISTGNERRNIMGVPETRWIEKIMSIWCIASEVILSWRDILIILLIIFTMSWNHDENGKVCQK